MISKSLIYLIIISSLFGTSFGPSRASQMDGDWTKTSYLKVTKICEIRKNTAIYVGKLVRVHGVYKTDHSFYSFIVDESCSSMKIINVVDAFHSSGDKSVMDFFKHEKDVCPDSGPSVCPTETEVDAVAKVCKQPDGKLLLDLKKVVGTSSLKREQKGSETLSDESWWSALMIWLGSGCKDGAS